MKNKKLLFSALNIGSAFFTNLAAGYFFAIPFSPNFSVLTNHILFLIVSLYLAIVSHQYLKEYE